MPSQLGQHEVTLAGTWWVEDNHWAPAAPWAGRLGPAFHILSVMKACPVASGVPGSPRTLSLQAGSVGLGLSEPSTQHVGHLACKAELHLC